MLNDTKELWAPGSQATVQFMDELPSPHLEHSTTGEWTFERDPYRTLFERITPNSGGPKGWKTFTHYRLEAHGERSGSQGGLKVRTTRWCPVSTGHYHDGIIPSSSLSCTLYNQYGAPFEPFGNQSSPIAGLPPYYDGGVTPFVVLPLGLDDLRQRSLAAMLPTIQAELSLLNSILELRDFKSLPRTISDLRSLKRAASVGALKPYAKFWEVSKALAQAHLSVEFAIKPLVSDIVGIYTAITRLERKMNSLVSQAGKRKRKHFTSVVPGYGDLSGPIHEPFIDEATSESGYLTDSYLSFPTSDVYYLERYVSSTACTFHAEIEYQYNYTQYQVEHARILGLLDFFGVNLNPAIVWNAIPWSFVVDWLLRVGDYLETMKYSNMEPQINILRYLWSVKRHRYVNVALKSHHVAGDALAPQEVSVGDYYETAYHRAVGLPTRTLVESSGLTAKQFSLGASLVVSQKRTRNR